MSAESFMRMLLLRWRWVVFAALAGLVAGGTLAATLPRVYEAQAKVIISVDDSAGISAGELGVYLDARTPTLLEILRSREFQQLVARRGETAPQVSQRGTSLSFVLVPDTSVVEIQARDQSPVRARAIAAGAADIMTGTFLDRRFGNDNGMTFELLQRAEVAPDAASPDPIRIVGLGFLAGLLLGLMAAIYRHNVDKNARGFSEITSVLGTRILAVRAGKPGPRLRRQILGSGAVTSIPGLIGRLGLGGRSRGTVTLTVAGIDGTGNGLTADLLESAGASGLRCALVTIDPSSLLTAHYRALALITGLTVVDLSATPRSGMLTVNTLVDALPAPMWEFDLIVFLSEDINDDPNARGYFDLSDMVLFVSTDRPRLASLRAAHELADISGTTVAGVVVDSAPSSHDSGSRHAVHEAGSTTRKPWPRPEVPTTDTADPVAKADARTAGASPADTADRRTSDTPHPGAARRGHVHVLGKEER
jgi:capsular polysaccharide biosynthesis protein